MAERGSLGQFAYLFLFDLVNTLGRIPLVLGLGIRQAFARTNDLGVELSGRCLRGKRFGPLSAVLVNIGSQILEHALLCHRGKL